MATPAKYDWDAHWRGGGENSPSRAQREAAEVVLRHAPDHVERVADLGSGAGVVTCLVACALAGAEVVGVDASPASTEQAGRWAKAQGITSASFVTARAEKLPFADASLDLVYADQLLQYTDEAAVFAEVARALRPGGRAIVIVPNAANLVFAATAVLAGDRHGSRRTYTRRSLGRFAHAAGLRVVGWDGYLPAYPVQRIGYFYAGWVAPLGTAAERFVDAVDGKTQRGLSRRLGFGLAVVAERP